MIFPGTGLMPTLQKYCHPLYFERRFIEDLSEQVGYAKGLRAKHGVQLVRREDFAQNIHKTAFILGSGASINNLSEGNWAEIRQNFSIGLNFSLLQDFVPNAYSAETPDYPHDPGFEENERALLYQILKLRKDDYKDTYLMIRGTAVPKFFLRNPMAPMLEDRVKMAFSLRFHGDTWETREKYVNNYATVMKLNRKAGWFPFPVAPGLSASILFLTTLCYLVGFKRVVLCGVDLNDPTYFFEVPRQDSRMVQEGWPAPPNPPMVVHPTFNRDRYKARVNVKDHFLMLKKAIFDSEGFELYSGSPTSALLPEIPFYPWAASLDQNVALREKDATA